MGHYDTSVKASENSTQLINQTHKSETASHLRNKDTLHFHNHKTRHTFRKPDTLHSGLAVERTWERMPSLSLLPSFFLLS